jgi:hypothetical protein
MKQRALQFLALAAIVFGTGATLHIVGIGAWPWAMYGIGFFVLVQVMVKWVDYMFCRCPHCNHVTYVWPWSS